MRDLLIVAVIAAVFAGGACWKVQDWRYGEKIAGMEKTHAQEMQKAESDARVKEQLMNKENERIANESSKRTEVLATRAASSQLAVRSLRDHVARLNARPAPADPVAAAYAGEATTARELLGSCSEEYQSVARSADELRDQVTGLQDWVSRVCKGN